MHKNMVTIQRKPVMHGLIIIGVIQSHNAQRSFVKNTSIFLNYILYLCNDVLDLQINTLSS